MWTESSEDEQIWNNQLNDKPADILISDHSGCLFLLCRFLTHSPALMLVLMMIEPTFLILNSLSSSDAVQKTEQCDL